jgi:hypothetical protein
MEDVRAVRKERGAALTEVETAVVQFSKRRDQIGRGRALVCGKSLDLSEKFFVRELSGNMNHLHVSYIPSSFLGPGNRRRDAICVSNEFSPVKRPDLGVCLIVAPLMVSVRVDSRGRPLH